MGSPFGVFCRRLLDVHTWYITRDVLLCHGGMGSPSGICCRQSMCLPLENFYRNVCMCMYVYHPERAVQRRFDSREFKNRPVPQALAHSVTENAFTLLPRPQMACYLDASHPSNLSKRDSTSTVSLRADRGLQTRQVLSFGNMANDLPCAAHKCVRHIVDTLTVFPRPPAAYPEAHKGRYLTQQLFKISQQSLRTILASYRLYITHLLKQRQVPLHCPL